MTTSPTETTPAPAAYLGTPDEADTTASGTESTDSTDSTDSTTNDEDEEDQT